MSEDDPAGEVPANPETVRRIANHIEQNIGEVSLVLDERESSLVHIALQVVAPTQEANFYTVVTAGMSDKPMTAPPSAAPFKYAELLICLPPWWPMTMEALAKDENYWPLALLKKLARYPHRHNTWLFYGHTVPNGEPPTAFGGNTRMSAAILSVPLLFGQKLWKLIVSPEKEISFFSVIPIYAEERDFAMNNDSEGLLDLLNDNGVTELLDVARRNECLKN